MGTRISSLSTVAAESSHCYQMVTSGPTQIAMSGGLLRIGWPNRSVLKEARADKIESVSIGHSWFWNTLSIRLVDGEEYSVGGLATGVAVRLRDALLVDAERIKAEVAAAQLSAMTVGDEIMQIEDEVAQLFSGKNYVRHSEALALHSQLDTTMKKCTEFVKEYLVPEALSAFQRLEKFRTLEVFEKKRNRANDVFIQNSVPAVKLAAKSDFGITLTDEQAIAIATDEEATLVLAGAGTGKTAVITGKIAHLVRNRGVAPEDILVLAFNRTATQEIRNRLPEDLNRTKVYTFHGFGNSIIGRSGIKRTVSKFAEDERVTERFVNNAIDEILSGADSSDDVSEFVAYHRVPYQSPFDFDSPGEYFEYVSDWDRRTLNGVRVKSFEELEIANFLTLNGIKFEYETPYGVNTATRDFRQYQPDFYLPDYDIYIEHFALDENGNAPSEWNRYVEGVKWKRSKHKEYGTTLIETYSWQRSQGVLRTELQQRLTEHGVRFKRMSIGQVLRHLATWVISWLARLMTKFLDHVKTGGLSRDELRQRASDSRNPIRSRSFINVFEKVWDRYEEALNAEETIDFHDMINKASDLIRDGRSSNRFRYVLVDEFQDTSVGRVMLLNALYWRNIAYFLVGDDWQSINRFAGSDVSLVKDCGRYLGYVQARELTETFRFGNGILKPSIDFVQRNPEQTQRNLRSSISSGDHGITIVSDTNVERAIAGSFRDIKKRVIGRQADNISILVLGRYRDSGQYFNAVRHLYPGPNARFSTIHRAKGREDDYVIVLDLKNARMGFPAKIEDDPLLEMVLPPKSAKGLPYAEERRLFYVAMTRARRGSYLITDARQPSEFVTEIRKHHQDVRQIGNLASEQFPNCPKCSTGQLIVSQSEKTLRCTNYPMCDHLAPRCEKCLVGYLADASQSGFLTCTNSNCDRREKLCQKCKVGWLKKRSGPYSEFWGCTEYSSDPLRSDPPCRYTTNEPIRSDVTRSDIPPKNSVRFCAQRSRRFVKR